MVDDVIVSERLLDEQQVEYVELLKKGEISERVRRVGVDLKGQIGVSLADPAHHLDIVAGTDFELDPSIALVHELVNPLEEDFDRWLDSETDAGEDLVARAAEHFRQRSPSTFPKCIPTSHFQPR